MDVKQLDTRDFYNSFLKVFEGWQGTREEFSENVLDKLVPNGFSLASVGQLCLKQALVLHHPDMIEYIRDNASMIDVAHLNEEELQEMEKAWKVASSPKPVYFSHIFGSKGFRRSLSSIGNTPIEGVMIACESISSMNDTLQKDLTDLLDHLLESSRDTLKQLRWIHLDNNPMEEHFLNVVSTIVDTFPLERVSTLETHHTGEHLYTLLKKLDSKGGVYLSLDLTGMYRHGMLDTLDRIVSLSASSRNLEIQGREGPSMASVEEAREFIKQYQNDIALLISFNSPPYKEIVGQNYLDDILEGKNVDYKLTYWESDGATFSVTLSINSSGIMPITISYPVLQQLAKEGF